MSVKIHYIGHSAFFIEGENSGILIDPFINGNPSAVFNISSSKIKDILLTHGHGDHLGDAIPLSKKTGAPITAIFELANYCAKSGVLVNAINLGGIINLNGAKAVFLPAFHSSSTPDGEYAGMSSAILAEVDGLKIYHAGDTCIHAEMKTAGEIYKPDIALLPIGSHYTMGIDEAVTAADWLGAKTVIPMHYNTFAPIKASAQLFKEKIQGKNKTCVILKAGECHTMEASI